MFIWARGGPHLRGSSPRTNIGRTRHPLPSARLACARRTPRSRWQPSEFLAADPSLESWVELKDGDRNHSRAIREREEKNQGGK